MKNGVVLFLLIGISFLMAQDANSASCKIIPTCSDLGYLTTPDQCGDIPHLKCPFDQEKAYCLENCDSYPLDSCDEEIGTCKQCAVGGKWKYIRCNDESWTLSGGRCIPQSCPEGNGFRYDEKPDENAGVIEECRSAGKTYYRYASCNNGWLFNDYRCEKNVCEGFETQSVICPSKERCNEVRPRNAKEFTDEYICKSGSETRAKITCMDGYFLQDKGSIYNPKSSGSSVQYLEEDYKCRKHKVGNIALYCKNEDEIISIEPEEEKYKNRPAGCEAIGVVFYNDTTTRIVGLKNIWLSSGKVVEQSTPTYSTSTNNKIQWSSCPSGYDNTDTDLVNESDVVLDYKDEEGGIYSILDGDEATKVIENWLETTKEEDSGAYQCSAPAAQVTRAYYPRLCLTDDVTSKTVCEDICSSDNSKCGGGKWYLPTLYELSHLYVEYAVGNKDVYKALELLEGRGDGYKINTDGFYWSSTEGSSTNAWGLPFSNGGRYNHGKSHTIYGRPVLTIE